MPTFRHLSRANLESLAISAAEGVAMIEQMFERASNDMAWSPPKAVIQPGDDRYMMAALAACDEPDRLVVKTVVLNPDNPKNDLPQINGLVCVLDSKTGLPVAVMDGNWITAMRTAALSATAASRLAREDATSIAFLGCGVQASSHLAIFSELYDLKNVTALGRGTKNIERLGNEAKALGLSYNHTGDAKSALADADIVVSSITLSASLEPFIDASWVKPGAFVAITDFGGPWHRESFSAFDPLIIDDRELELQTQTKLAAPDLISGDLGELMAGNAPARTNEDQRTCFIYRAHPMGDLAYAALACQKAEEKSVGTILAV